MKSLIVVGEKKKAMVFTKVCTTNFLKEWKENINFIELYKLTLHSIMFENKTYFYSYQQLKFLYAYKLM